MKFLEITHTNQDFIKILKDAIKNKKPLSLCRIGDGEIHILNNRSSEPINRFAKRWGYSSDAELVKESRKVIINCIKNTDWLGVVGYTDFMNNWHQNGIARNKWFLDYKFVEESNRIKEIKTVDAFMPRTKEFGDVKELRKILNRTPVAIISPLTNELKANQLENLLGCKINYVTVPNYCKLNERDKLGIIKKINSINEHVILTSWTLLGKDFHHMLSNKGKICLDMGSVISAWAGKQIRNDFKKGGVHRHCYIKRKG